MSNATANAAEPQPAPLGNLKPDAPEAGTNRELNLDVVLDIPVTLSMEVGRSRVSIRNLLQLNQGSVVELERATGEPPRCSSVELAMVRMRAARPASEPTTRAMRSLVMLSSLSTCCTRATASGNDGRSMRPADSSLARSLRNWNGDPVDSASAGCDLLVADTLRYSELLLPPVISARRRHS